MTHFPVQIVQGQDFQADSHMHRTISVYFNIFIEGEVELNLELGGKRILKRGDANYIVVLSLLEE